VFEPRWLVAENLFVKPGPLLGIRSVRLWSLSAVGRTVVQARGIGPMPKDQARLPYGRPDRPRDPRRQPDVPLLIAAYRLLGVVVSGLNQRVRVVAWEHPWVRSFRPAGPTRLRHARLPAAAALVPHGESGTAYGCVQALLLPDLGDCPGRTPPSAYAHVVGAAAGVVGC